MLSNKRLDQLTDTMRDLAKTYGRSCDLGKHYKHLMISYGNLVDKKTKTEFAQICFVSDLELEHKFAINVNLNFSTGVNN